MLTTDTSTYNTSTVKIEINQSGINELYHPIGQTKAAVAAFFSASSFSLAARSASLSVDTVMMKMCQT